MKSIFFKSLFFIAIVWTISGCAKDEVSPWERYQQSAQSASIEDGAISDEQEQLLESFPNVTYDSDDDIILPNGLTISEFDLEVDSIFKSKSSTRGGPYDNLGPQTAKNKLIRELIRQAKFLVSYNPSQQIQGETQTRLAYVWGSKDIAQKRSGSQGGVSTCTDKHYGLDCSGFIYQIFLNAGIDKFEKTNKDYLSSRYFSNKSIIENAIHNSIPALKKLKVETILKSQIGSNPKNFKSGDIVYWRRNGIIQHIGIILETKQNELMVYQCNGRQSEPGGEIYYKKDAQGNITPSPDNGKLNCDLNASSPKRGPWAFVATIGSINSFGLDWEITRINSDISGTYNFFMRCKDFSTDVFTAEITLPSDANQTKKFTVTGEGTDYDNIKIYCKCDLVYDAVTNHLSGNVNTTKDGNPWFYRNDSFDFSLNKDNTDYFELLLGDNYNAGCETQGRLQFVK